MKKWAKSNWGNCTSLIAIAMSVTAICLSLPTEKPIGIDYMGVLVGILSILVTILVGWQIWSAISIEKKINERVEDARNSLTEAIEKTREDLGIAGARATAATLYQAQSISLNVYILAGKSGYNGIIKTLAQMEEYALAINEYSILSDFARVIVETKKNIDLMEVTEEDYEKVCSFFLKLSQNVLTRLPASDARVPHLLSLIETLTNRK